MPFDVYDRSLELITQLAAPAAALGRGDRDLANQLRRAASSIVLNIAEGRRREGKDQRYHFRVAAGSAEETRACLHAAAAWGHLDGASTAAPLATLDRVAAMLYRLTR
jgi:four helix bundle protein